MKSNYPIFKPRYSLRTWLVMFLPTLLFFGMMCNVAFSFSKIPMAFWLLIMAVGLFASLTPFFFIREIRFQNEMVVRRHFLPDLFFTDKEFEQVNMDSIQAGGQRLRIGQITNLEELKEMTQRWKAAKILKKTGHENSQAESPYIQRGYGIYASFWGLMFGIIVTQMNLPWLPFDPRWVLGGTFMIVYFIYIYVLPKYL